MKSLCLIACLWGGAAQAQSFTMPEDEGAAEFVTSNVIATFYHELGHALIDVLQLPVLGREEDAADTLSALLIHQGWEEEAAATLTYDTANAYWAYSEEAKAEGYDMAFWDEHSLDMQRYYNLICLYYGAEPDLRADDAKELGLPDDRAERCPDEYQLAADSWGGLLEGLEPGTDGSFGLKIDGDRDSDPILEIMAQEVDVLNESYALPEEVTVLVAPCGEPNAFYSPSERTITFCTEYATDLVRIYMAGVSGD